MGDALTRVLVAEDDPTPREVLERMLVRWGYEVILAEDGREAWERINRADCPGLLVLDRLMPGLDGMELCRRARALERPNPFYIVLLTGLGNKDAIVEGLEAGADDYIAKPFNAAELRARIRVGQRIVQLQEALNRRVAELQHALDHVKTLQGLLPICMYCHRIRADESSWEQIDHYLTEHTDARLSHGLCPECAKQGLR
jgi:DNA-binding response OmpR family regulator